MNNEQQIPYHPSSDNYWSELRKINEEKRKDYLKKERLFQLESMIKKIVNHITFYMKLTFLFFMIYILLELSKWGF